MFTSKSGIVCLVAVALSASVSARTAAAAEWFVAPGGTGTGTVASPFGRVQDALTAARAGDVITVAPGTYPESLRSVRGGTASAPIRLRAATPRAALLTVAGRVLRLDHPYIVVEGFVIDGQYGGSSPVAVNTAASYTVLRNLEVRRSSRDLVALGGPTGVLIEDCLLHHALNATGGRTDAHGIGAGPVRDLTIRRTEIHTFSGDGVQVDPGRSAPGWDRVTIEDSRIWLRPLPAPENGFPAGTVPGENALDTKANGSYARARIVIRDTEAWGYRHGLIANMAAFNMKEHIDATIDRVTVYDSEIAFRLRAPALVAVQNAVVHDVAAAFRYEDNITGLRIWNSTVGGNVTRAFRAASSSSGGLDVRNVLLLGTRPAEAWHTSNLATGPEAFVDVGRHDYRLAAGAIAIDRGTTIAQVTADRLGTARPQGAVHDVGAYEWTPAAVSSGEVVVWASRAHVIAGGWRVEADSTAAGGSRLRHPDAKQPILPPLAAPQHFFDVTVQMRAGVPYRLWVRGRADKNAITNDSLYVQFSGAVDATGAPTYRMGTTSAAVIHLPDCGSCPVSGWGWQDHGSDGTLGPLISFEKDGVQTIRVQTREDGMSIDQIVLSPSMYLDRSPGALTKDTTILPES